MAVDPETQGQIDGAGDTDAWPARDREIARTLGTQNHERATGEVGAVVA